MVEGIIRVEFKVKCSTFTALLRSKLQARF